MPSVNVLITAIVAGLVIGTRAGPCRPRGHYSSVTHVQVTITETTYAPTDTSEAFTDVFTRPETTSIYADTASLSPTTTTSASEASDTTEPGTKPTTTDVDTNTSETTTEAEETTTSPSTTAAEEPTDLDTTTFETTTSAPTSDTTSTEAPTTTSEPPTSTCPPKEDLVCGEPGFFSSSTQESHLLDSLRDTNLAQCQVECQDNDSCKAIGFMETNQCDLYDVPVSELGFESRDLPYYIAYDACCFKE
ncbi:hypothetical protein FDECE_16819 [Fusarium decemcellulare]|nr:hypothetical protein FDECE_16819 [Fusarium decemcellulare]